MPYCKYVNFSPLFPSFCCSKCIFQCSSLQSLSYVWFFGTEWNWSMPGFPVHYHLQSLLKLMSIESVMPSSIIAFSSHLQSFPASGSFQWVSSLHQVAKGSELQSAILVPIDSNQFMFCPGLCHSLKSCALPLSLLLHLHIICHFPLVAFNILSLSLIFVSLITMCLGVFLRFILPGTLCAS